METVYIETTIVSYLVAKPSRDVVVAGQQQATRDWWERRRSVFYCVTSPEMAAEAARGDAEQVRCRLAVIAELTMLPLSPDAEELAARFLQTGALPEKARSDAIHLAVATNSQADYLLTWNCRHLANGQILRRLEAEAAREGWRLPTVCTPFELMGDSSYEG
jgi:hypothetical protein